MKKVILVAICMWAVNADAQFGRLSRDKTMADLRSKVDTIRFKGDVAPRQRYKDNDLHNAIGQDANENNVKLSLITLQSALNNMYEQMTKGRPFSTENASYFINKIKEANTGFDMSCYDREYALYYKYRNAKTDEEIEAERAAIRAKDYEERRVMEENRNRERRIRDSIDNVAKMEERARWRQADSLQAIADAKQAKLDAEQEKKDKIAAQKKKEKRKADLIAKYGPEMGPMIASGNVQVGMTKEMCIDAWGKPSDINRTTTAKRVHEQWVYNLKSYLYFEGNILTTIQN